MAEQNNKNFLLVVPQLAHAGETYNFPFGIAYVSSYMKSKGYNVFCLNLCHLSRQESIENIIRQHIEKYKIDVFCTGTMSWYWDKVDDILKIAKKIKPNIITIVGGAIVISDPELAMRNLMIDIGIIGEGEITTAELAEALANGRKIEEVKGICFMENGELMTTPPRPYIENLDALPFPDYEGFEFEKWLVAAKPNGLAMLPEFDDVKYAEIIGSRSCPFSCTFCYHHLGQKYRQRSLENVFSEIDFLVNKYKVNCLYFLDELFSANHERMIKFAGMIKKYNLAGWGGGFRVNNINADILKVLKDSGLKYIGYGLENMNDEILTSMNKRATRAENENALKLTREAGIMCTGNIIFGDPAETVETYQKSLQWVLENPQYNVNLVLLKPIPNAPIFQYAIKKNLIKDKIKHIKEKFPIINLTKMSEKQFQKMLSQINHIALTMKQVRYGKVIETYKINDQKIGRIVYAVKIECPFCHNVPRYNIPLKQEKLLIFSCKHCTSGFKVYSKEVFLNDYSARKANLFYLKMYLITHLQTFKIIRNNKEVILSFLVKAKRKVKNLLPNYH